MNELDFLIEHFPQHHWRADETDPHRWRAHDRGQRKWHHVKFTDDSQRWAMYSLTEEFIADDPGRAAEFATQQLDRHLGRLAQTAAEPKPYDRSSVVAELSAETDLTVDVIERLLDTLDRLGIQPEDWRQP